MSEETMRALREALENDESLAGAFADAQTAEDVERIASEAGIVLDTAGLADGRELSDAELEAVSGGYTFAPTDWIYCDNPWTNVWCTLKC